MGSQILLSFANDPRAIAVAAVRKDGRAASYSSPGACLLVAAPSGDVKDTNNDGQPDGMDPEAPDVLTTDRTGRVGFSTDSGDAGDYANFNGTSASSPQVAGVVALMLSANPNPTYRDVQQILIHSARHYDLTDPDVRLNGAGFRVSHNVGFGVPDAGFAVELARSWSNRPPVETITSTNTTRQDIPDDGLRVVCGAPGISDSLTSIRCLPSLGLHPDGPSEALPIVFVGQANEELSQDLNGKAALIQRGTSFFADKIARAARAGAAFALIFNTYWTTQHFYESSAGEWRLEVSDERNTVLGNAPSGSTPATGSVTYAQIIINGVPIGDVDRDGLDDSWEFQHFGHLDYGPKDDPDEDGFTNAREQIVGTNSTAPNAAFRIDLTELTPGFLRLSWPSQENVAYKVLSGGDLSQPLVPVENVVGGLHMAESVVKSRNGDQFYRVFRAAGQRIQLPE